MKHNILILCIVLAFVVIVGHLWVITDGGRLPCQLCRPSFRNSMALPDLVAKTLPAVVELRPGFANWLGAGVLISNDGWIMTAGHVVEDQEVMIATMIDGVKYMSVLIVADPNDDIAILKIDIKDAPYVRMSKVYPRLGQSMYIIGHPLGVFNSVSVGIVSNIYIDEAPFGVDLIMTDAEVTGGNSGGGLFDMSGCLIGIVVAGTVYSTGIEANLAVPVSKGRELLNGYLRTQEAETTCDCVDVSFVW